MNKTAKALLIPVAAFAVTVTGAQAFNSEVLEKAGLSTSQISAFEEAYELRRSGDKEAARDLILDAGIDREVMESVRSAMKEYRIQMRTAVDMTVENNDYTAFKNAVEGSFLADLITSKDDFERFVEARTLKQEGDIVAAREIMTDLGFGSFKHWKHADRRERPHHGMHRSIDRE